MAEGGMTLYKVTGPAGEPIHGGSGWWPLPKVDRLGRVHKGAWLKVHGPITACVTGLHLTEYPDVWLPQQRAFVVWEAEGRGDTDSASTKVAYREARLLRSVAAIADEDVDAWRRWVVPARTVKFSLAGIAAFNEERSRVIALIPQPGRRLVFGVHRIEKPTERYCAAWPTPSSFERAMRSRSIRRGRELLGMPSNFDRALERGESWAIDILRGAAG
jgi:hypothetical protein